MNASTIRKTLSAMALAAACFALAGCSEMLSREDFTAKVKDKSDTEVRKAVGKPASVDNVSPDQVTWTYNERTFNIEQNNKFDPRTVVVFSKAGDGQLKASEVKFD